MQPGRSVFGLEATIGGQTSQFLLDTGASTTLLSPTLRQRLKLTGSPVQTTDLNYAVAGKDCPQMTAARLKLPVVNIGSSEVRGLEALQFDQALIPDHADGILGMDILGQFSLIIDPQQRQLSLNLPRSLSPAERLRAIPLEAKSGVMLAQLRINDQGHFRVLVDTGAGSTFISPAVADGGGPGPRPAPAHSKCWAFVAWRMRRSPSVPSASLGPH
ncbi:MAG: hypothetical protein HC824_02260, partial [Synechococcales cyanobacterium RM1_1_8]|nr:hypothetical protein [Synechococcales cyanobacterium RM1_1_8]